MIQAAKKLSAHVSISRSCESLAVSRATYYRQKQNQEPAIENKDRLHPRALRDDERQAVLDILHEKRFMDKAPAEVFSTLLDEGIYYCSTRTMYRILDDEGEVKERRNQLRHPQYKKPELIATGPNQVWSWDITKLLGPVKWSYYYLYVILDIFSRYVVGWMIAPRETTDFARQLIGETCQKQNILSDQLIIHADRGAAMKSMNVAQLYALLGITKSFCRPYTSTDNPYSESHFKTLKYSSGFPGRFGSFEDALSFCRNFFAYYNSEHRHSGIGFMTPETVHYGKTDPIIQRRKHVLLTAYAKHPERFVRKIPAPKSVPDAAWINKPEIIYET